VGLAEYSVSAEYSAERFSRNHLRSDTSLSCTVFSLKVCNTLALYCTLFPQSTPWMSGTCMDSILQIRSNLSHPASYCCKCARYNFPSTVVSRMPGICMNSIMQMHSNLCHPTSHCSKCAIHVFASAVVSKMAGICINSIKVRCIKDQSKKSNYKLHHRKGTLLTLNCLWCTCATMTTLGSSLPLHPRGAWNHSEWNYVESGFSTKLESLRMERLRMERLRKTLSPNWNHVEWTDSEWKDSERL
jgi:hypothetical protein